MNPKTLAPRTGHGAFPVEGERPPPQAALTAAASSGTEEGQAPAPEEEKEYLRKLRSEFPTTGIVADIPGRLWMAVRGRDLFIRARSGTELRERLLGVHGRS